LEVGQTTEVKKRTILENEQERDVKTLCQIIKRMCNDLPRQKNLANKGVKMHLVSHWGIKIWGGGERRYEICNSSYPAD